MDDKKTKLTKLTFDEMLGLMGTIDFGAKNNFAEVVLVDKLGKKPHCSFRRKKIWTA